MCLMHCRACLGRRHADKGQRRPREQSECARPLCFGRLRAHSGGLQARVGAVLRGGVEPRLAGARHGVTGPMRGGTSHVAEKGGCCLATCVVPSQDSLSCTARVAWLRARLQ